MSTHQRLLGQYELQQRMANTTVDEDWKAFDTQRRRYVSVKLLRVGSAVPPDVLSRFLETIKNVITLQHPNIVPLLDCRMSQVSGSADRDTGSDILCAVSEYIEGMTLTEYLKSASHKSSVSAADEIVHLFSPLAAALDYAHQHGVIHGSIRPDVMLLDKHSNTSFALGEPKLTGFSLQSLYPLHSLGLHDVYYISPEVAQGYAGTARSDIYSFGAVLYELYTGIPPFQKETPQEVIMQHIHAIPTPPAHLNPHLPAGVTSVLMRCLAKDPAIRFANATEVVTALAKALNVSAEATVINSGPISLPGITPSPLGYTPLPGVSADPMNNPTLLTPQTRAAMQGPASNTSLPTLANTPGPVSNPYLPAISTIQAPASRPAAPTPFFGFPPTQAAPPASPVPLPAPPPRRSFWKQRGLYIGLAALVLLGLLASVAYVTFFRTPSAPPIVGHAFFTSSGILSLNSNEGIADGVQIELNNFPAAPSGQLYYAWLLPDSAANLQISPILLATIPASGGNVKLTYAGNAQHSDLLAIYSRFLITEESANPQPLSPSLDPSHWKYTAAFSQVPNPLDTLDHFSLLDHLRHLLAQDPKLKAQGLTGGLDIWLFRNTEKLLEWAGSARDIQQQGGGDLVYRQLVRILDYLDGAQYVRTEPLRPGTPLYVDPTIARVALLEFDTQNQVPPGYLLHISNHLRNIINCPGITPDQKQLALQIATAINNVTGWLEAAHTDAEKLVQMDNTQLSQPAAIALFNDLFVQVNNAFVGQTDPNTNQVKEGVVQIHYEIQRLATFDITPYQQ
jgi:serine/threonine protein kinase